MEALERLHTTATRAYKCNPKINFEVFIHKVQLSQASRPEFPPYALENLGFFFGYFQVDGLSEDYKMETQRDIHQRATDELVDSGKKSFL